MRWRLQGQVMAHKPDRFSPWREDFYAAAGFLLLGGFSVWRVFVAHAWGVRALGLLVAAACLAAARWAWRNGMRRWYGKHMEQWAVRQLGRLLDGRGIKWEAGRRVRGLGDVDFLAHPTAGAVVVEIKSFERWGKGWLGLPVERDLAAIAQTEAQMDAVGAIQGYLWLPRGRPSLLQRFFLGFSRGRVIVVLGSERRMARWIARHHSRRDALVAAVRGRR